MPSVSTNTFFRGNDKRDFNVFKNALVFVYALTFFVFVHIHCDKFIHRYLGCCYSEKNLSERIGSIIQNWFILLELISLYIQKIQWNIYSDEDLTGFKVKEVFRTQLFHNLIATVSHS